MTPEDKARTIASLPFQYRQIALAFSAHWRRDVMEVAASLEESGLLLAAMAPVDRAPFLKSMAPAERAAQMMAISPKERLCMTESATTIEVRRETNSFIGWWQ
jgi:hypothetical protein